MHNLITWATPHDGQYGVPDFNIPYLDKLFSQVVDGGWQSKLVQETISFASYWKDPYNYTAYLENNIFLADLNNEKPVKNATYRVRHAGAVVRSPRWSPHLPRWRVCRCPGTHGVPEHCVAGRLGGGQDCCALLQVSAGAWDDSTGVAQPRCSRAGLAMDDRLLRIVLSVAYAALGSSSST